MSDWPSFWKIVVYVALASYFGLAIVITIGGFYDVKRMFRRLDQARAADVPATPASPVEDPGRSKGDT